MDILGRKIITFCAILLLNSILRSCEGEETTVCENEDFRASCHGNTFVVIESAVYGRTDFTTCLQAAKPDTEICQSKSALSTLNRICYGKQECNVTASDEHFESPCGEGVSKYLQVAYQCITDDDVTEMCSKYTVKLGDRPSGYIRSRNYPNPYKEDDCLVKLRARSGFRYRFQLLDLDVEARRGTGCYDWLKAIDEQNPALTFNYCGKLDDIHTSEPSTAENIQDLTVSFRADAMTYGKGFLIKYEEHEAILPREEL